MLKGYAACVLAIVVGSPGCGHGIAADGGARDRALATGGTSGSTGAITSPSGARDQTLATGGTSDIAGATASTGGAASIGSSGAGGNGGASCEIVTVRADADGDGFTTELGKGICQGDPVPPGFALPVAGRYRDCDDANPNLTAGYSYRPDRDGDGLGDSRVSPVQACAETPPPGMVTNGRDCDDTDPQVLDADADQDGDGYSPLCTSGIQRRLALLVADCDDHDATRHPSAEEYPLDGVDSNCDGFDFPLIEANDDCVPLPNYDRLTLEPREACSNSADLAIVAVSNCWTCEQRYLSVVIGNRGRTAVDATISLGDSSEYDMAVGVVPPLGITAPITIRRLPMPDYTIRVHATDGSPVCEAADASVVMTYQLWCDP